ncbi:hypothetical protein KIW84_032756 [Lathyrus oleraceus]|uniref:Protein kinase domain-containing protein n=1 Tax=Pisum sativum TaxID=3888 RepID=A0A9D4XYD5_PEA|nr:hypothetical protein KIW84_032756 [Pisum sativum]
MSFLCLYVMALVLLCLWYKHNHQSGSTMLHPQLKHQEPQLLWNIYNLHNGVRMLKSGINAITSRNASKFSESENFSLVPYGGEVQTSSAQSPTSSVGNEYTTSVGGGGVFNSSQNVADEYDFGDFVFSDSAVSSFGEASNISDIIESTAGLLAAAEDFKTATQNPVELADVKTEVEADGSIEKWKKLSESNEMIDENWLRFYWQQILQAINTIHEERIVHSNLKPANFLQAKEAEQAFRFAS